MIIMDIEELITFCTLKGTVDLHEQAKLHPEFWRMRMIFSNKMINFQYHKHPETGKLTFIEGRLSTKDSRLGTCNTEIHGFKHLMKNLT
jgi:hypothetical protein